MTDGNDGDHTTETVEGNEKTIALLGAPDGVEVRPERGKKKTAGGFRDQGNGEQDGERMIGGSLMVMAMVMAMVVVVFVIIVFVFVVM